MTSDSQLLTPALAAHQPLIRAEALSVRRGGDLVLDGADLALAPGESVAIQGRSGARISSLAPAIQFDLGELGRANPDFHRFPLQMEWLTVGAAISLFITAIAILSSVLGAMPRSVGRPVMRLSV